MKKLRIGMVGAGSIAGTHLSAYQSVNNAEIVAICDINENHLNDTADKFGIEKRYNDEAEMLRCEELDAVDVCVWNSNHAPCSIMALENGLHVICEKPMAYSVEEAIKMKEAAEKNNKLLMIGFVMRFEKNTKVAADFIKAGKIGDIYYSRATYLRRHGAPGGWFCKKEFSGGGPVIDLGVHVIDQTRYLMGSPKAVSVYAKTSDKIKNRPDIKNDIAYKPKDYKEGDLFDVEDFGTALITYDNGATTLLETSYSINSEDAYSTELFGTKGGIKMGDESDVKIFTEVCGYISDIKPDLKCLKNTQPEFVAELQHFTDCALNGETCIAGADEGIEVMKILSAIYESARTGHEVIID